MDLSVEAFNLAKSDHMYKELAAQVKLMIFLSTPHQGCNNADYLDTLFRCFNLPRDYIRQLSSTGHTLQELNYQFSQACVGINLVSFYETVMTSKYGVKAYVSPRSLLIIHELTLHRSSVKSQA